jgi:two-component system response regulator RegX3
VALEKDLTGTPEILIVDDEPSFAEALSAGLSREGFRVSSVRDGATALSFLEGHQPDLVLLDLMLPGANGFDVCRAIRAKWDVPVIMLTARSSEVDTVVGLELGADDYVVKPFRLKELSARIRAVLRRRQAAPPPPKRVKVRDVVLERDTRRVYKGAEELSLTNKEFDLLELLLDNAGKVLTRDHILEVVWDFSFPADTKTLDVHIKRLREKLGDPSYITTIRGVGYRFEA